MRMGTLRDSDLIAKIGWEDGAMDVQYKADMKIFRYYNVSLGLFRAIVRSKHPGEDFLKVRDHYRYKQI